ncbi:MAG: T9SS type A sorting domain-containing protein [Candidatus Cloacimonetes bacterium]|nr:T9SS type A sorting domain-containing protein [Candidatus Cloacimonadota bacterium]
MKKLLTLLIITLFVSVNLFADWGNEQKVSPSDGGYTNRFGYSVFISGDFAVMGAPFDSENGIYFCGSTYIYHYNGSSWSEQAKLLASDSANHDRFGYSVSISGNFAVIGAYEDDDNGTDSGSAYIYHFNGSSWSEQAKLLASDGSAEDHFGNSVSIFGDYAVIGAYEDNVNGTNDGSAYIYYYDGSSWSEHVKLFASDGEVGDHFGNSVSISGDYTVIGAYGDNDYGSESGSAYLFYNDGSNWSEHMKLTASDGATLDYFGNSVCISGDYAVIGAYGDSDYGPASGSAYFYENLNSAVIPSSVQCIEYPILKSAYPNPFNPSTTISFSVHKESTIELSIFNIKGQKIKSLLSDQISAGEHSIIWKGNDDKGESVSSGVYLYKLIVNDKTEAVKKCLLLK